MEPTEVPVSSLVVVAEFRDPIYPGLRSTGRVERGGVDKPFHTVINSENFHALQTLLYTHEGTVDAIYIDPPYNTGAKDWKYNNDYVDGEDAYRHSKWLAMMERRLKLAKRLLNSDDSVLIVTIDEKEYLRLGMLLEQLFPEADMQTITAVTNRAGSTRSGRFSRLDEYVCFLFFGEATIKPWVANMLSDPSQGAPTMPTVWFTAVRRGSGSALRAARPNLFYPLLLDAQTGRFDSVGDPLPSDEPRANFALPTGTVAVWPLSNEGREQTWRFSANRMREYFAAGTARLGRRDANTGHRSVTYLQPGTLRNIEKGIFLVNGRTEEGALELELSSEARKTAAPGTVWNLTSHYARDHGSKLVERMLPNRRFPFPKSIYAVEDTLRFFVADKPDALVLDFFAGSGTTAHAVMRLNKQDGGCRQSVSVTNNEVSVDEQRQLRAKGHKPGDPEWEELGICEYITKPRLTAAITGTTPDGLSIKGDYKFTDEFPMADGFEENAEFFDLTYESPRPIAYDRNFEAIAALLWLHAGARGSRIESREGRPYAVADTYAVLFEVEAAGHFVGAIKDLDLRTVYIITDDPAAFSSVVSDLPAGFESVRLYESYLENFTINTQVEEG